MKKLLVICGSTASGKTKLALKLARLFSGELVSADSRQVYKGMDIGTGKDLSLLDKVPIWGIDLADPKKGFSVAQYQKITQENIKSVWRRKKLPIIVGGTGLYIKALTDGIPTAIVPPNRRLRKNLEKRTVAELFDLLAQFDSVKAAAMNMSDRKNPRRLIRAIEIAQSKEKIKRGENQSVSVFYIGLKAPLDYLEKRIRLRTKKMFEQGIIGEIRQLLNRGVTWQSQALNTIGYKEWQSYFEGKERNKDKIIALWVANQLAYAKAQMVWFKKDKRINWFDISQKGFEKQLATLAKKWYKKSSDQEN